MAVERVRNGEPASEVIAAYGFNRTSIYKWLNAAKRPGVGVRALRSTKGTGRPRRLTPEQERRVLRWIKGRDPRQYGLGANLWTRALVAELIEKGFSIRLGLTSVGSLLARLGLTPQKPKKRSVDRKEHDIVYWKNCIWPTQIKGTDNQARKAHLVFIDECGFMLAPLLRRTWAPRGHTPVIKIAEPHGRISTIGAITISPSQSRFRFYFHLLPDNANFRGKSIATFIESLQRRIRKPLIVIWDQIPIHQSYPVDRYLDDHKDVSVEPFPPYAPELNPVDFVWGHIKYGRLANYCPKNLNELREKVISELFRVRDRPDLLRSFFNATGLTL
jgi:transposase